MSDAAAGVRTLPEPVYGLWTVLGYAGTFSLGRRRRRLWKCRCGCKRREVRNVREEDLLSGGSLSCGCRRGRAAPANKTHGHASRRGPGGSRLRSPTFRSWQNMVARCGENHPRRRRYHDRGVRVAPEWVGPGGFVRFLADLGERPGRGHHLVLVDKAGDFAPGNVAWRERPRVIDWTALTYLDFTQDVAAWASDYKMTTRRLRDRVSAAVKRLRAAGVDPAADPAAMDAMMRNCLLCACGPGPGRPKSTRRPPCGSAS